MAIKDTLQLVKETQEGLKATSEGVRRAKNSYKELQEQIRLARGRLSYKKSSRHADVHVRNIIKALRAEGELRAILQSEIEDAVLRSGKEFEENREYYTAKLNEAANDDDLFLTIPMGAGWASTISPQIVFERAGSLLDYSRGIIAYRQSLKTKVGDEGSGRGAKATSWWYRHVYGNDTLYKRTIEGRVAASGRDAPFWSLIAHGTVSLGSDRPDGSYNPLPSRGVNFILNAEEKIKKRFDELMKREKSIWDAETREFEEEIKEAESYLKEMDSRLEQLTTDYQKNQATIRRYGEIGDYIDEDRLADAAEKLRAGERFEQQSITLSAPGTRLVRTRVSTLRGRLEY